MTPARDRLARILMIGLGLASVGAFATPALTFDSFPPERVNIEAWRMFGYLVFAGLFTLLGLFPRRMTGIWELVLFHKAGVAIFLAYFVKPDPAANVTFVDSTNNIILVDTALTVVTFFCYLLTSGWRAWSPRGESE
ncbi:MAG: hypothetical protein SGI91_23040 [Alphaproteobacteria bacterium]|jgi:hypothetical protein|nr:hypothetical protein [Alphaproteobacteria bacterium]